MNAFFDLLQSPSFVLPIFAALFILASSAGLIYWGSKRDEADESLEYAERTRSNRQAQRLQQYYTTGKLTPPWASLGSVDSLDTSPRVINTPYADMAAKYGFDAYKHHTRGELILFDTRFEQMDVQKRVVTFRIDQVTGVEDKTLKRLISGARTNVNKRAQRAGLLPVRERRGKPGKEVM